MLVFVINFVFLACSTALNFSIFFAENLYIKKSMKNLCGNFPSNFCLVKNLVKKNGIIKYLSTAGILETKGIFDSNTTIIILTKKYRTSLGLTGTKSLIPSTEYIVLSNFHTEP
jgi:hypothetical protein